MEQYHVKDKPHTVNLGPKGKLKDEQVWLNLRHIKPLNLTKMKNRRSITHRRQTQTSFDGFGFIRFTDDQIKFQLDLPPGEWDKLKKKQMERSTEMLREHLNLLEQTNQSAYSDLIKNMFDVDKVDEADAQLSDIRAGNDKIKGYTWHHHQIPGIMQLVPSDDHKPGHIGGTAIWAEGNYYKNYIE